MCQIKRNPRKLFQQCGLWRYLTCENGVLPGKGVAEVMKDIREGLEQRALAACPGVLYGQHGV